MSETPASTFVNKITAVHKASDNLMLDDPTRPISISILEPNLMSVLDTGYKIADCPILSLTTLCVTDPSDPLTTSIPLLQRQRLSITMKVSVVFAALLGALASPASAVNCQNQGAGSCQILVRGITRNGQFGGCR